MITDMIAIAVMSIVMGIVLLAMGLSFISESLESLKYNNSNLTGAYGKNAHNYYDQNPLWHYGSKYFHYRPKGTVIVSKREWKKVEEGIGAKIDGALSTGKKLGYREAFEDIRDRVDQRKERITPSNAFMILGVKATDSEDKIYSQYLYLMDLYHPKHFKELGDQFIRLAELKTKEINKAYSSITASAGGII